MEKRLTTPFTKDKIKDLKAGDSVLITGTIYTASDAAHERMTKKKKNGIPALADRLQPAEWTRTRRCF